MRRRIDSPSAEVIESLIPYAGGTRDEEDVQLTRVEEGRFLGPHGACSEVGSFAARRVRSEPGYARAAGEPRGGGVKEP
jgi:hypothetical protein